MRKIQPIHGSSSFVLVIPKEFVADLKISSEDYVKCTLVGDSLVVKKADI
jgi:antitoxin component of MazEF toxin-antitoxin module